MSYPYVIRGLDVILTLLKSGLTMKKLEKSRKKMSGYDISAAILAR